jgi:tetratricopeptide (TPR) repeat protein
MWHLIDNLLRLSVLTATAAAAFVAAAIAWSALNPASQTEGTVASEDATVEIRLSSHGGVSHLFVGQPLVVDIVLLNLEARRARNQAQVNPEAAVTAAQVVLDSGRGGRPWQEQLILTMSTPGGATVLNTLDWNARLLDADREAAGRRLVLAPVRTTFVLGGEDLAALLPGRYILHATLPPETIGPDRVSVIPLEFERGFEPATDSDRAVVSLAVARVAGLRGQPALAVEAGLTALALDPLQDEALAVVAEGWEQQGDIERAIEWYERYFETLPDARSDQRRALQEYIEALRRQRSSSAEF